MDKLQNPTHSTPANQRRTPVTHWLLALGIVTTVGTIGVAQAHPERGDRFPISIAQVEEKVQNRFADVDTDGSGDISLEEFTAAKPGHSGKKGKRHMGRMAHFAKSDDTDRAARKAEIRQGTKDALFTLMDADADGNISEDEFKADNKGLRKQARKQALFQYLDEDNNGRLSLNEMPNPAQRLRQADADADGQVSREEMRAALL